MNPVNTPRSASTLTYWEVSKAARHETPGISISTGAALSMCLLGDQLPPEMHRLKEHFHTIKFDIVEGNTEWRKDKDEIKQLARVYRLTPFTAKLTSTASN